MEDKAMCQVIDDLMNIMHDKDFDHRGDYSYEGYFVSHFEKGFLSIEVTYCSKHLWVSDGEHDSEYEYDTVQEMIDGVMGIVMCDKLGVGIPMEDDK